MEYQRPTKKQRELLSFVDGFIKGNGYGPSYREIMRALDYKSVSTVAIHIDGLIARGFLKKSTHSARSLELVVDINKSSATVQKGNDHIAWLKSEIKKRSSDKSTKSEKQIMVLQSALAILDQSDN